MVNSLCTDLLVHPDSSDWEHANIHAQPPRRFQARHQLVRLHLSVPDSHLSTTSASEMFHLVAYLSNAHASGLNVEVSSSSNPGVLLHVLKALHDALVGMELSVSIPSSWTQVDPYILDLVDYVLAVPPMASSKDSGKTVDSGSFVKSWLDSGFHAGKLIVGLPSAVYSSTDKEAKIPSHRLDELCNGTNLISWIPKRTQDDQLLWHKHNVNGEFRMLMGSSVEQQVAEIRRQNLAGVFLFDHESLHDRYVVNPICRRHRSLFTRSVHRAVHEHNQPKALDDTVVTSLPEWKLIGGRNGGGRLGHVLVYATPSQEEEFITYFNITNDATLLASPVEHVVLGYDKQGHIYNLHRPRCGGDGIDDEMLEELIQRYSLDIVASWRQPPPVLIFPGATNSSAELLRPHAVPILITWFKKFLLPRNTHRVHHQEECHGQHVTNWLPRRLSVAIPDSSSPPDSVLPIETETITVVSEIPTTVTTTEATTTTTESPTTKTTEPLIISYEATTMAGTEAPTTIRFVETDPEDETPFLTTRRPGLRPSDLQSISPTDGHFQSHLM